ncbi:hypothetical protein D3C85_1570590 [compost metagenome]
MIVTLAHLRSIPGHGAKPGFCASGARRFFARYGLDWSAFIKGGIEEEQLLATGDALAKALVEHARGQAQ